jgi:transposase
MSLYQERHQHLTPDSGTFPEQVRAPTQYGPGVRGLGCYLLVYQHLPIDRAARLLADVVGAPVATGTLAGVVAEAAAGLDEFAATVRHQLAAAPVAHFDQTGARVAGRLHWVHSASTASLTWQTVHPKRGRVAMDAAGVLPAFGGVAVHDGWSPYWHYQAAHALCGAHLLRELDAVGDEPHQGWAAGLAELLCDAKLAADRARATGWARVDEATQARLKAPPCAATHRRVRGQPAPAPVARWTPAAALTGRPAADPPGHPPRPGAAVPGRPVGAVRQ